MADDNTRALRLPHVRRLGELAAKVHNANPVGNRYRDEASELWWTFARGELTDAAVFAATERLETLWRLTLDARQYQVEAALHHED